MYISVGVRRILVARKKNLTVFLTGLTVDWPVKECRPDRFPSLTRFVGLQYLSHIPVNEYYGTFMKKTPVF